MTGRALALARSGYVNLPTPQDLALAQDLKYKKLKVRPSSSIFRKLSCRFLFQIKYSLLKVNKPLENENLAERGGGGGKKTKYNVKKPKNFFTKKNWRY